MFQKNVQWFIDRLVERMVPTIGSHFAAALQRMLILSHAEHHNQLEEQAQRYEALGRNEIAELIRTQAKRLTTETPLLGSQEILDGFDAGNPALFEGTTSAIPLGISDSGSARRQSSRKRRIEDSNEATEIGEGEPQ